MVGHGTKFSRKKDEAIAALLTQRNIEEAARSVGIAPNTLLRWMKETEFDTAYREAKRAAFGQSIARLQQGTSAAATTLLKIMIDPAAPASVRVRAADSIFNRTADQGRSRFWKRSSSRRCGSRSGGQRSPQAMRAINGRLSKLEQRFGIAGTAPGT